MKAFKTRTARPACGTRLAALGAGARRKTGRSPRRNVVRLTLTAGIIMIALPASPAQAQARDPLSPARFAALESIYTATLPLDHSVSPSAMANVRRTCIVLDHSDRLLAAMRRQCLTSLKILARSEAFGACVGRTRCSQTAGRLAAALSEMIINARASNRIVNAEVPAGPCRTELRAGQALLRSSTKLRNGLRLLERGLRTRSRAATARAQMLIVAASLELLEQPTAAQAHAAFVAGCRPGARAESVAGS